MSSWSIPAPVVALLCERVGRPWSVGLVTVSGSLYVREWGHLLPAQTIPITPDTHVLLAMRLYEALTGQECVAAWVDGAEQARGRWWLYARYVEKGALIVNRCRLPGVPAGVTCEACDGVGYVEVAGASGEPDGEGCGACGGTVNGRRGSGRRRVTDPDEALAWACCWLVASMLLEGRVRSETERESGPYAGPKTWAALRETWADWCADLTLHTPLRDGVALEAP